MTAPSDPTPLDRLMAALRRLVRAEFPDLAFFGIYEYAVQAVHGAAPNHTIDATPTDTTIPLPALNALPMRSGIGGTTGTPAVGAQCLVQFVNGDPTRPYVSGFDPVAVDVQMAGGGPAVARVGDVVNAGYLVIDHTGLVQSYFQGTALGLLAANAAAAGLMPPGTVIQMTGGTITSGSGKVTCG